MIALAPRDDVSPLRLAAFDEILPRELERGLDRLRPAADEEDMADARRRVGDEIVGQFLRDLRGEEAGMRIGEPVELLVHRGQHVRMRMPQTGHRRAARSVDVLLAGGVADDDAVAARGDGIGMAGLAMKDMGHDRALAFLGSERAVNAVQVPDAQSRVMQSTITPHVTKGERRAWRGGSGSTSAGLHGRRLVDDAERTASAWPRCRRRPRISPKACSPPGNGDEPLPGGRRPRSGCCRTRPPS